MVALLEEFSMKVVCLKRKAFGFLNVLASSKTSVKDLVRKMVGILKGVRGSCLASGHGAWALQSCVVITVLVHHQMGYSFGWSGLRCCGLLCIKLCVYVGELLIFANVSITGINLSLTLNYCSGTSSPVWIAYIFRQLNFRDISQYLWTYRFGECFL
ncbi:hypothetical protein SAY86_011421 [Trapa natans]|uniref:Uncharacterized protein n=1 Tax=Trapa natans TaxID=22666 RepID=A0AAN7LGE3_TRANT|nr:hypothetical protein SAY86_011421 [Trapa natans]